MATLKRKHLPSAIRICRENSAAPIQHIVALSSWTPSLCKLVQIDHLELRVPLRFASQRPMILSMVHAFGEVSMGQSKRMERARRGFHWTVRGSGTLGMTRK